MVLLKFTKMLSHKNVEAYSKQVDILIPGAVYVYYTMYNHYNVMIQY